VLWDYLKTLITLRLTLQSPCMCAGCQRGRRYRAGIVAAAIAKSAPARETARDHKGRSNLTDAL
jgi:hypothetical protein